MNENLQPVRTEEEARAKGRKGGIASGKARLAKKKGRELVQALLAMKEPDPRILADLEAMGVDPKQVTKEVAMHVRQIEKAIRKADTTAYREVNRMAGYLDEDEGKAANVTITISAAAAEASKKWGNK